MEKSYLFTEKIAVGYRGRALIEDVQLSVRRGEIMTLIGPNGAGKSTILKSIARQLELISGAVYLDGRDMAGLEDRELARRLALVLTEHGSPELVCCEDVVAAGRYPYTGRLGILSAEDRRIVGESLALVNARDLAKQEFSRISDGQRQRILLARAICQQPEVIVLDEPTSFLDVRHKLELLNILKDLVRQKELAVVMSLHELDLAQKISDLVVCVREGAIDRCGPPEQVFTAHYIHQLFGITSGSYNAQFGCVELAACCGTPSVFVIGGGGSGIPVYRKLQRDGVPFEAGILHKNDLDHPVARALAARVVEAEAWEPVSATVLEEARAVMAGCAQVVCCLEDFGTFNQANRQLMEEARQAGKLVPLKLI